MLDMTCAEYGMGVNTHMGQTYGASQVGLLLLGASAAVTWWKRRRVRSLGVPPLPSDCGVFVGLFVVLTARGLLFPLTGLPRA
ncbi:hypothetical protein KTN05_12815 [Paracoccus sp. Z118]|uniref:hypothetical protein n=1 Tax=Paracoccus sp. Z118 TaxID=2851017 RepID=UPI001C2C2250|nr:hypothetical protein [Paracoccus sp. Z118]MBV0892728.1 hypothetical protein [Paracoccus sp. Z118]